MHILHLPARRPPSSCTLQHKKARCPFYLQRDGPVPGPAQGLLGLSHLDDADPRGFAWQAHRDGGVRRRGRRAGAGGEKGDETKMCDLTSHVFHLRNMFRCENTWPRLQDMP